MDAKINIGNVIQSIMVAAMMFLMSTGVGKLDKLTEQISELNVRMAAIVERNAAQERMDNDQDKRLDAHNARILEMERAVLTLRTHK